MKIKIGLIISLLYFWWNAPLYANIKIGTVNFYPPYVISDQEGFDIDLLDQICTGLHEKCKVTLMNFKLLFPALREGKIDLAISGLTISKKEHTFYIYSRPYMVSKAQFLVRKNSKSKSISDLKGKLVGVLRGNNEYSVFYDYLSKSKEHYQIIEYSNTINVIDGLNHGAISAALIHDSAAAYWSRNSNGRLKRLGSAFRLGDGISILALPKNAHLIHRVNQQLDRLEKDDALSQLHKRYFYFK